MMKIENRTLWVLGIAAAATIAAGCKKEEPVVADEPPPPPPPTETAPPPPPPDPGCDAATLAQYTAIFADRGPKEAPKMKPEGSMICGVVPEGGSVTGAVFMLDPTKCYTVIANGLPNVTELDVHLMIEPTAAGLPPNIAAMAAGPIAQDSETGAMGTIGPKQNCYKFSLPIPIPIPVKVVVKARNGYGPVAAQVFSRPG